MSGCEWCRGTGQVGPVEDRYECPRCVRVPRTEVERLRRIEAAAEAWWCEQRPVGWSRSEHCKHPAVNVPSPSATALAVVVSRRGEP